MEAKATTGAEHNFPKTTEIRSEASKIHQENIEKMAQMSEEEILQEREELLKGLDPKLIESLIGRSKKREATGHEHNGHTHEHAEGYHGWIGSMKTSEGLTDLSQLDKEDVDRALGISSLSLSEPEGGSNTKKSLSTIISRRLNLKIWMMELNWIQMDGRTLLISMN